MRERREGNEGGGESGEGRKGNSMEMETECIPRKDHFTVFNEMVVVVVNVCMCTR